LDGPNFYDWIFRNQILQGREENLYVDFAESDGEGHYWHNPPEHEYVFREGIDCVFVAQALSSSGCITPESLSVIADIWRKVEIRDDFHCSELESVNIKTLESLLEKGLLQQRSEEICETIIYGWLFPLHSLQMGRANVGLEELKDERQKQFYDDIY
jgi:hypothetical protein